MEKFPPMKKDKYDYERHHIEAFTYQLIMKKGWSDYAMLVLFDQFLRSRLPLATPTKLLDPNFPVPISIVMGSDDWMLKVDKGASQEIINSNKKLHGNESNYYLCPNAGHVMNCDNPDATINIIINDIFYNSPDQESQRLPIV